MPATMPARKANAIMMADMKLQCHQCEETNGWKRRVTVDQPPRSNLIFRSGIPFAGRQLPPYASLMPVSPAQGYCTSSRQLGKMSRQFCRRSYSRSREPYRLYAVAVWIADKSRVVCFVIVHAYAWTAVRRSAFTAQTCATDRSLPRPKGARSEYGSGVRPLRARPFQGSPYAEPLRPASPGWLVRSLSENELWATAESSAMLQSTKVVAVGLGPGCSTRAT